MRVLVTGGAGFIGSHIVDQLLGRGHQVSVVDNLSTGDRRNVPAGVPVFEVDICDTKALAAVFDSFQPECVSHQAAQMSVSLSMRNPVYDTQVNVMGTVNVFENSARVGARRIVFASSGGVLYGDVSVPAKEGFPCNPISPYGIAKWVGERYMEFYVRNRSLQGVALRYANVYGPRQNPHGEAGVVAIFSEKMLADRETTINGDGKYIRDYVYVTDVARANVLAIESELSTLFVPVNIGTGLGTDVNELAAGLRSQVENYWKSKGIVKRVPECRHGPARSGDLRSNLVCADLADQLFGWKPTVRIVHGLRDTVEWFVS